MCDATCSESGQLLTIKPCGWYLALKSDRDHLAGVVAGMGEQGRRNLDALRRAEAENARLREALIALRKTITTAHVDMGGHHRYGIRNGGQTISAVMMADNALKEVG